MIKIASYNKNINIYNKVKTLKKGKSEEEKTYAERFEHIFNGTNINLSDPNGITILNSGFNFVEKGKTKIESEDLTNLVHKLHKDLDFFNVIAGKTNSAKSTMIRAIDYNNKVNWNSQNIKTSSSLTDVKAAFENLQKVKSNNGKLFIFDTETIGGKANTGIWNPLGITEFAMQEYDFGTGQTTATNVDRKSVV